MTAVAVSLKDLMGGLKGLTSSAVPKGGSLAKSRKLFFQGRSFLEGKIQKMQKKISKIFIVPNRSLGHTDHLYTYKGHIEHVGFT